MAAEQGGRHIIHKILRMVTENSAPYAMLTSTLHGGCHAGTTHPSHAGKQSAKQLCRNTHHHLQEHHARCAYHAIEAHVQYSKSCKRQNKPDHVQQHSSRSRVLILLCAADEQQAVHTECKNKPTKHNTRASSLQDQLHAAAVMPLAKGRAPRRLLLHGRQHANSGVCC
jgi:hypothetical protein